MRTCSFCRSVLKPNSDWKGSDGAFYCNEFCAETADTPSSGVTLLTETPRTSGAP
jgi:hypothetical protein